MKLSNWWKKELIFDAMMVIAILLFSVAFVTVVSPAPTQVDTTSCGSN